MKKLFIIFTCAVLSGNAATAQSDKPTPYGKEFKAEKTMDMAAFNNAIDKTDKIANVTVSGTISEVCQAAGCWVKLKNPNGEDVFVKFKDHFTIPLDMAGKNAIVHGTASRKTISVEERKHLAEDAGKTADEIAKITSPKKEVRIDATGIIIN